MDVRLITTSVTQTRSEAGRRLPEPTLIVVAAAVVANPLAGRGVVDDLTEMEELGSEVASLLADHAVAALTPWGLSGTDVRGYGKGAIVGLDGEREHTAAILHPRFGAPVRAAIGGGADIIPGTKKVGPAGSPITMPIGNKDDRWVFDDMDATEIAIPDAPKPDEVLVALALSVGGRPHARTRKPGS